MDDSRWERVKNKDDFSARLLSLVTDAVVVVDQKMRVTFINAAAEGLFGRSQAEVVGRPVAELTSGKPPQDQGEMQALPPGVDLSLAGDGKRPSPEKMPLYRAMYYGETVQNEEFVIHLAGDERLMVQVSAYPVYDSEGQIVAAASTWRDITGRKVAEEELYNVYAELEQRIKERTVDFASANMQLEAEVERRKQTEAVLEADLQDMRMLHDFSARLVSEESIPVLYDEIISMAVALTRSSAGMVQILDETRQELLLLASQGFHQDMIRHFARIDASSHTSCGMMLATGKRAFFDFDAPEQEDPSGSLRMYWEAGYHSAQSTPLITRSGRLTGVITTHWREPGHRPSERELRFLDLLTRQAADLIERAQSQRALRESEERFRTSIENMNEAFTIFSSVRVGGKNIPGGSASKVGDDMPGGKIVDFRYEYVNEATCLMTRRTQVELINHLFLNLWPNHKESGLFDKYVQVVETGMPLNEQAFDYELGIDGQRFVSGAFDIRASKFGDGLIVTVGNVTEQVQLEEQRQKSLQEREVHHRLAEQREMERQSFAHDIHDGPIQTLSSLAFYLQSLKETHADEELRQELDQVSTGVKGAIQELRTVMNELRPPAVIRFGLSKAIRVQASGLRERYPHIVWDVRLDAERKPLPEQISLALFRIYQEALNNIVRHAEATKVWVRYQVKKDHMALEIRDNGKGFSETHDFIDLISNQHYGLAGMMERSEAIGGELEIRTHPGQGTTILVRVPVRG